MSDGSQRGGAKDPAEPEELPADVLQALKFLQQQNREVHRLLRRLVEKDLAPPAAPPKFRRAADGTFELWAGEGTGWIPYHGHVNESDLRH